jgi:hypothetical protein
MANEGTFTISVKDIGLSSHYLYHDMQPGMTVVFEEVGGTFTPPPENDGQPVLLLAAGIGALVRCNLCCTKVLTQPMELAMYMLLQRLFYSI